MATASSLPARAVGRAVNRALRDEDALRGKLAAHAGAVFRAVSGPVSASFAIAADGALEEPQPDAAPQLTLSVAPHDLPRVMHDPAQFTRLVRAEGDDALAATLAGLATTVPWFVERLFASAFGAIAGQRLADAGRALLGWPAEAIDRMSGNVTSYVRDESRLGVARDEARAFADEVAALEQRVAALAARVDALRPR